MRFFVRDALDHPDDYTLTPEILRELLTRLCELLEQEAAREAAKRPANRPRSDNSGELVEIFHKQGKRPLAVARRIVAKAKKKELGAVTKAHQRYLKRRDKTTP
jgi:hypothetical protein